MTHKERVLNYMQEFGSITSLDAFKDLGNTRLSASIWLLIHKDGIDIDSITETSKNRYGEDTHYSRYFIKGSLFEKNLINKNVIKERRK